MRKILWLDDIRDPVAHGYLGAIWVKTADEAIHHLQVGDVEMASLDHDLSIDDTIGQPKGEKTGYDVVLWMEENNVWPKHGVRVHSMNPVGRQRMQVVIDKHYDQSRS